MKPCLLALSLSGVLFLLTASVRAQETNKLPDAILVKDSQSPNRRERLVIVDNYGQGVAAGTVQVKEVKTGKILGYFEWSGFGEHPTEDVLTVLWRPDSRAFAISYEVTRGYVECKVYALEDERCVPVELPDFTARIARKYGLEIYPKGGEHPFKWLSGNRLEVDVYNRSWEENAHSTYRVTLRLPAHPVAAVEKIDPAP